MKKIILPLALAAQASFATTPASLSPDKVAGRWTVEDKESGAKCYFTLSEHRADSSSFAANSDNAFWSLFSGSKCEETFQGEVVGWMANSYAIKIIIRDSNTGKTISQGFAGSGRRNMFESPFIGVRNKNLIMRKL